MAAALLVVVVAFSWAHSTARVSRGLGLTHPHAACVGARGRETKGDAEEGAARFAKSSIKCITRGDGTGHRDGVCLIYFDARRGSTSCRSRPFLILFHPLAMGSLVSFEPVTNSAPREPNCPAFGSFFGRSHRDVNDTRSLRNAALP